MSKVFISIVANWGHNKMNSTKSNKRQNDKTYSCAYAQVIKLERKQLIEISLPVNLENRPWRCFVKHEEENGAPLEF